MCPAPISRWIKLVITWWTLWSIWQLKRWIFCVKVGGDYPSLTINHKFNTNFHLWLITWTSVKTAQWQWILNMQATAGQYSCSWLLTHLLGRDCGKWTVSQILSCSPTVTQLAMQDSGLLSRSSFVSCVGQGHFGMQLYKASDLTTNHAINDQKLSNQEPQSQYGFHFAYAHLSLCYSCSAKRPK